MTKTPLKMTPPPLTCETALKEWAVAIEALGQGRMALIIRKGGIREENNRFEVRFPEFLLFPSFEHQQSDLLRPEHATELINALNGAPDEGHLAFSYFAKVHSTFRVTELAELESLTPYHIWTEKYAETRLRWRPRVPLTAMVLRVYKLLEPKQVPVHPEYAGCKSWIPLLDTVAINVLEPVMSDGDFEAEAAAIDKAMATSKALA